jgi:hypothetical protein
MADFKKTKIAVLDFQLQGEGFSSRDTYGTMVRSADKGQLEDTGEGEFWKPRETPSQNDRAPGGPKKPVIPMPSF